MTETRGWRAVRRCAMTVSRLIVVMLSGGAIGVVAVVFAFGVLIEAAEEVRVDGVKSGEGE